MKVTFPLALAAALIFGCSSSNKNTKTAENDTGTTQPSSVSGAAPTAGTQATASSSTAGTSTPTNAQASNNPTTTDTNTPSAMGQSGTSAQAGQTPAPAQ